MYYIPTKKHKIAHPKRSCSRLSQPVLAFLLCSTKLLCQSTKMDSFQKLSVAILVLVVATSFSLSAAQKTRDEEGCVMSSTECTCAQSPAAGECTRPTDKKNCLQGDCAPSHRCDCFGYELCSINNCGNWSPAVNAILSRTAEFQCKYDAAGSKCRSATVFMDTLDAADNSKAASTKYVDDIAVDEVEMAADLKEALLFKVQTLDAFRYGTRKKTSATHQQQIPVTYFVFLQ